MLMVVLGMCMGMLLRSRQSGVGALAKFGFDGGMGDAMLLGQPAA